MRRLSRTRWRAIIALLRGGSVVYGVRISARDGDYLLTLPDNAPHSFIGSVDIYGRPSARAAIKVPGDWL